MSATILLPGCGAGGTGLPKSETVLLPDGSTVTVDEGSGAPSLANSRWRFYRRSSTGQVGAFATVVFGPDGNLYAFEDNQLAANIFGDSIIFDATRRATKQVGLQYAAATYGAETEDASGFAFEGRFSAFAAGFLAGTGEANAVASYDPDNSDRVEGTFSFSSEVTLLPIPEANMDEEFNFVGERVLDVE